MKLLEASNSDNTWLTYRNGLSSFQKFRQNHGLNNVWPCPITHIVNYVAFMFKQGYSPSTVKAYLSGISYYIKSNGLEDVTQSFIIQKMMRGMFRLDKRHDCRKPITLKILIKLTEALNKVCFSVYESVLFSCAFSIAFFGYLRVGEIAMSNLNSNHIVKISDVAFDSKAEILYVTIPFSKTDQLGHKTTLILKRSVHTSVCPVNLMLNYFSMRPNVEGPLFCHMNNQNLTRYQFSKMLRNALAFTGYSPDEFNTHSLRIGAATQSILNGMDEKTIMANGRWKSSCYKRYIRLNMLH